MNQYPTATSVQPSSREAESSIFFDPYQKEVLEDNWQHSRKRTMIAILSIGLVLFISNVIGFMAANLSITDHLLNVLLIPAVFVGLGVFARLQPMIAAIGGVLVILTVTVLNYIAFGSQSLIAGWLYKAICLYFILRSFQCAKDAEKAKKELALVV